MTIDLPACPSLMLQYCQHVMYLFLSSSVNFLHGLAHLMDYLSLYVVEESCQRLPPVFPVLQVRLAEDTTSLRTHSRCLRTEASVTENRKSKVNIVRK